MRRLPARCGIRRGKDPLEALCLRRLPRPPAPVRPRRGHLLSPCLPAQHPHAPSGAGGGQNRPGSGKSDRADASEQARFDACTSAMAESRRLPSKAAAAAMSGTRKRFLISCRSRKRKAPNREAGIGRGRPGLSPLAVPTQGRGKIRSPAAAPFERKAKGSRDSRVATAHERARMWKAATSPAPSSSKRFQYCNMI